ncbi:zinc-binding dehydrogenase [Baekduia alba]|uniref:zinc-binding dehydrogenase n=1 Tax=Baekduia alba TaxID=2997333 RepID=UPI0023401BEB|nr:zinc-binding dehydrogenase [Baekduia alba]
MSQPEAGSSACVGAVLSAPRTLAVVARELPPLGPRDVLVAVSRCGVCTGDVDAWLGRSALTEPEPLGHEPAGVVVAVGAEVTRVAVGERVACWVEEGGFADRVVTDEQHCFAVPETVAHPEMAEPLSCIVNAVELAAPALADDVVIVGAGFMGLLLQLVLQARGPRTVTVADVRPGALARAAALGATHTVDTSREDLRARVAEITGGRGADVAFEVTGSNIGLDLAAAATRMSGKLAVVGYHQGGTREIALGEWNWMAYTIVNAHFRDKQVILGGMRTALRLMEAGVVDVAPLISHRFALDRIDEAFATAAAKPDDFVKAVILTGDDERG